LKRDGRPLYELARRGEEVVREPRPVTIETLEVTGRTDHSLDLEVVCSKGTYIRVLGEDLAVGLGTLGHLGALRRLWVEPFDAARLVGLEQIEADVAAGPGAWAWLLPVDQAFPDLPALRLGEVETLHLRQGRVLEPPAGLEPAAVWRAYDPQGGFLGLVERGPGGGLRVQRLFVAGAGTGQDAANT
jgi:tRNA pseudouridine55 synthase